MSFPGVPRSATISIEVAPDPVAGFAVSPSDPSTLDTVSFINTSFDPAGGSIASSEWDLGDGTISTDAQPTHRYTADGPYEARLTIRTTDGRTASTTQTVAVQTHDVAVASFDAPDSGRALRTTQLTVEISNHRYQENVTVQLLRSVPSGDFEQVGSSTQLVRVRAGRKTTPFVFSYTFTPADASVGKVTFKVVASIEGARDAFPGDNTTIAPATKVRP
jgi:PKD repeat protein